jgi:hypothetical protein
MVAALGENGGEASSPPLLFVCLPNNQWADTNFSVGGDGDGSRRTAPEV